jgi:REase_AHJR-like
MNIKAHILQKYLHDIAIDQISEEYRKKGYTTTTNELLDNQYRTDLIARKGDETIVFEVRSDNVSPERKQEALKLIDYLRKHTNYKFHAVFASPPKDKNLEITEIKDLMSKHIQENFPKELASLFDHSKFEKILRMDIDKISIEGNNIFVSGDGVIELEFKFDSVAEKGSDNFLFQYEITLGYDASKKLKIVHVDKLEFDKSSYLEDAH